ncbi:hypothetical protein [Anatilimnocola floriformis]|uniref:hypothetical protein n=1 Tax=Anatilimnocola floriformis TaxID=2948575 RepID=UPI0020C20BAB|nr:hypothetical protein [Anatilimnocola floriformis]
MTRIWDVIRYSELPVMDFFDPPAFYECYQAVSKQLPFGLDEHTRVIAFGLSSLLQLQRRPQLKELWRGLVSECVAEIVVSADSYFTPNWRSNHENLGFLVVATLARGALNGKLQNPLWEERLRGQAESLVSYHVRPLFHDRYRAIVNCYGRDGKNPASDFCTNSCGCAKLFRHQDDYKDRMKRCANLHGIHNFCGSLTLDRWNEVLDTAMVGTSFKGGFPTEGILANYR